MNPGQFTQQPVPKKRKKWPWIFGGATALFVVIGIAAGGGEEDPTSAANGPAGGQAVSAQPAVKETPAPEPTKTGPITIPFGESHTWRGGEEISVSAPQEHTESNPYLAAPDGKRHVSIDVTITNNGDTEYQVMSTSITAQHNGRVADDALLMDNDLIPSTQLPPGDSVSFTKIFVVDEAAGELQVSVQPNMFAADTVYFTGEF